MRYGNIFWLRAESLDEQDGVAKKRPFILLTPTADVANCDTVEMVACSTKDTFEKNSDRVKVPHGRGCKTGLKEKTWAIPRWYFPLAKSAIANQTPAGYVKNPTLDQIKDAVALRLEEREAAKKKASKSSPKKKK